MGFLLLYIAALCVISWKYLTIRKFGICIFNAVWIFVLFICRNVLCNQTYSQTSQILFLMIMSVNIGYLCGCNRMRFVFSRYERDITEQFSSMKMLLLLRMTTVIFVFYAIQTVSRYGVNLLQIRAMNNSDSSEKVFSSVLDTVTFYGVAVPMLYVCALVCAYNFSQKKRTPLKIYCLLIINITLYVLTSGGRSLMLRVVIFYLAALLWRLKSAKGICLKNFGYTILGLLVFLGVMEIITISRNDTSITFLEQALVYIRGSVAHMQYQLDNLSKSEFYYGYVTYGGFLYYPIKIISQLFGLKLETSSEIMFFLQSYKYIQIGEQTKLFNAIVPNAFYYYYDCGYLGVVLFSMFLGFATAKGEQAYRHPYFLGFVIWATAIYAIVFSPIDSVLWTFKYPMALIYCFLLKNILYRKVDTNETIDQCDRTSL